MKKYKFKTRDDADWIREIDFGKSMHYWHWFAKFLEKIMASTKKQARRS